MKAESTRLHGCRQVAMHCHFHTFIDASIGLTVKVVNEAFVVVMFHVTSNLMDRLARSVPH